MVSACKRVVVGVMMVGEELWLGEWCPRCGLRERHTHNARFAMVSACKWVVVGVVMVGEELVRWR